MGINIDGEDVSGITIDGEDVKEVTIDGESVWQSVIMVDDFEYSNLSDYYNGHSQFQTLQTSLALSGNRVLHANTGQYGRVNGGVTTGLPDEPQLGDTFEFYYYYTGTGTNNFGWAADRDAETTNSYYLRSLPQAGSDNWALVRRKNGSATTLAEFATTDMRSTWYRLSVTWYQSGGDYVFDIYVYENVNEIGGGSLVNGVRITDTSPLSRTDGNLHFWNENDGVEYLWDSVRITNRP